MSVILGFAVMAFAAAQPAAPGVLICETEGLDAAAGLTAEGVCAGVKTAVEKQLAKPMRLAAAAPAGAQDWVRVQIQFSRPDTATATVSQMRGGKVTRYPATSISVSDRRIDQRFVDRLASAAAAQIQ